MSIERKIRILAGSMILLSLGLSQWVSPWFLLLSVFVALNLIQSAFTKFCPAEMILARLGSKSDEAGCCSPKQEPTSP